MRTGQTCTRVITRISLFVENFFFIVLFYCLTNACPESAVPAAESVEAVARLALDLLAVRCAPLLKLLRLLPAHAKNHAELAHTPRPTMKTLEELAGAHGSSSRGMKTELFQT